VKNSVVQISATVTSADDPNPSNNTTPVSSVPVK
jgi:hypothetical protein